MRKKLVALAAVLAAAAICFSLIFNPGTSPVAGEIVDVLKPVSEVLTVSQNDISAEAAVIIEADSRKIIWSKNADELLPMASTTKIMTAMLTLQQQNLDDYFTVDTAAITVEGSSMGLRVGDQASLRALAVGMLTVSGNDAANAAAVRICGSISKFVELMNRTAVEIGMKNTSFATPSGLDAKNHYSTAYDMALLAAEALENEEFRTICSSKSAEATYGNPPYRRLLMNNNRMLRSYDGAIGVKTGFTKKSGRCLVSAAERDGITIICVTLNAPNDWADHTALLDLGFSSVELLSFTPEQIEYKIPVAGTTQKISVIPSGSANVACIAGDRSSVITKLNLPEFVNAPIRAGDTLGNIEYIYNDRAVAKITLIALSDCIDPQAKAPGFFERLFGRKD
ncbi:MAG TPA: D-alanyl-D-alanine carboxypeptidase family protein [Clostridiales bacterium]|nr:D-alanyl-D-alanine carboxypeptidase family protein [Clostridiales bacterium]